MKLFTSLLTVITMTATTTVFAKQDFQGHRVGMGLSSGDISHYSGNFPSSDLGSGLKVEYGYDFNRIIGLNISLDKNTNDLSLGNDKYESDVTTFKADADIGYAFFLDGFSLKPYGAVGLARIKDEESYYISGHSWTWSNSNTSLLIGAGLRANLDFGLYTDLRFNFMIVDDYDLDQVSITVGYKF